MTLDPTKLYMHPKIGTVIQPLAVHKYYNGEPAVVVLEYMPATTRSFELSNADSDDLIEAQVLQVQVHAFLVDGAIQVGLQPGPAGSLPLKSQAVQIAFPTEVLDAAKAPARASKPRANKPANGRTKGRRS